MTERYRHQVLVLSRFILQGYALDRLELVDEAERLAESLQQTIRDHVEQLEHRRKAAR